MTTNLYRLSDEERVEQGVEALPGSLGEAIEELAGSELLEKALGEHIFPRYVELKRKEWDEYRTQVYAVGARPVPGGAVDAAARSDGGPVTGPPSSAATGHRPPRIAHDRRCRRSRKASGALVSDGRSRVPGVGPVVVVRPARLA